VTPYFYVYDDHYHCFACAQHGNAINFLMAVKKITYGEAVEQLAAEVGMTMPALPAQERKVRAVPNPENPIGPTSFHESAQGVTIFQNGQFEAVLGTAARILVQEKNILAASILANGKTALRHWDHDNWDGGQDTWRLYIAIAVDTYLELENREEVAKMIDKAIAIPMHVLSQSDFIDVEITTALEHDPDWREKTRRALSGEGINNQGRVRTDNIAAREFEGLRFRSRPEELFYSAMKSTGLPFAPLPVVVQGGMQYRRIEPDFVVFSKGIAMVVEIDGDTFHTEKPADADARLRFLREQGLRQERIKASECNTPEKAREAAQRIVALIDKLKASH